MDLHVPLRAGILGPALIGTITDGLDAVVIHHEPSKVYENHVHLVLAGNARDLAIAAERASKMGGVVD